MIYRELERAATTRPTSNCLETFLEEELKMAESNVEQILVKASIALM
jgi:hypothetical protein